MSARRDRFFIDTASAPDGPARGVAMHTTTQRGSTMNPTLSHHLLRLVPAALLACLLSACGGGSDGGGFFGGLPGAGNPGGGTPPVTEPVKRCAP
jgi:hypothetical protein